MKKEKNIQPPRWAQRLLAWYCRADLLEDLQGDLNEYFDRHRRSKGPRHARFMYVLDVFKFLRPYTIRKPEILNPLIHWIMISSYIKTSGRSLMRNKLFSAINIAGLAVSMSVGLLVISFISDLYSFDDFHVNKNRMYRVTSTFQHLKDAPEHLASTSIKAGKKIQESVAGAEQSTLLRVGFHSDATTGETTIPVDGIWADKNFFDVFSFTLLQGDPATALKDPYTLVLTETSAKKIFGAADALGKSVTFDTTEYVITGIVQDIPKLSHMRFEVLVSFATYETQFGQTDPNFVQWESIWQNYLYIVVPEKTMLQTLQTDLNKLSEEENKATANNDVTLSLQAVSKIVGEGGLGNEIGPALPPVVLWVLIGLAFVIIISACFNYTNLSIARSMRRSKEVGIRKVIGAVKGNIAGQFMTESIIISLLALVFAFLIFLFLRVEFLSLDPFLDKLASLELSYRLVGYFTGLAVIVGIAAGALPAIFFSRINAIQVLKNMTTVKIFRNLTIRKVLIIVQYTFSLIFISTTIIGYSQYKSFLVSDLGFKTENILNIKLPGGNTEPFIHELSAIPAVTEISKSMMITSLGSNYTTQMKYQKLQDSAQVFLNTIDEHYLPLHKHKLLAGRNYTFRAKGAEENEVIVNEQVLKRFDIAKQDPQKALGEVIIVDGKKLMIIGVLKDFHYGTMEHKIQPVILRYSSDLPSGYLNVKITSTDLPATMKAIENAWKKLDKVHSLDATFYDDQIEEAYAQFSVMTKVIGFIGFLAVCIASMGLFGMVVFTTETRLKEISIRKVLGATEGKLIFLLSKGFIILLALAACIALPATYLFFEHVVLVNFAYHEPIGFIDILLSLGLVMALAFLMIGSQTFKVARSNPAEVLKNE